MRLILILFIAFAPLACTVVEEEDFEYEVVPNIGEGSTYNTSSDSDSLTDSETDSSIGSSFDTEADSSSDTGTDTDSIAD